MGGQDDHIAQRLARTAFRFHHLIYRNFVIAVFRQPGYGRILTAAQRFKGSGVCKYLLTCLLPGSCFLFRNRFLCHFINKTKNGSCNYGNGKKDRRISQHIFHALSPPLPNAFGSVTFSISGTRRLPRIIA